MAKPTWSLTLQMTGGPTAGAGESGVTAAGASGCECHNQGAMA
jgi:hypothetical protein